MRQRVSIARAFAVEPDILLCDEPFSSLDEMTARDLRAEFVRLVKQDGKTAVFITHHINEAMDVGDRIMVFHRPARIAYEARMDAAARNGGRQAIQDEILKVLGRDATAGWSPPIVARRRAWSREPRFAAPSQRRSSLGRGLPTSWISLHQLGAAAARSSTSLRL